MSNDVKGSIGYRVLHGNKLIPTVKRLSLPKGSTAKSDNSGQDNKNGVKSQDVGWKSVGDMTLSINDTGGSLYADLYALWKAGTKEIWTVQKAPANLNGELQGQAFISGIEPKHADDGGAQTIELTISPTGEFEPVTTLATGLSGLTIADDDSHALTLVPSFSATVYDYEVVAYHSGTENNNSDSVTLTPSSLAGTIYVNGIAVTSGQASGAITLNQGQGDYTLIGISVTEPGKGPTTYLVRVKMGDAAYVTP
nr:cadherin-like beta sandwich domain-containing protein [uncultured Methanoregula sp.]